MSGKPFNPLARHGEARSETCRQDNAGLEQRLHWKRHKIENMFSKLKDWRRIYTRYDRCAHTFFSSMCIAAAVIFWL
ncbi:transposase [Rhizobium leguminosarum]|uniref:Transposase n=1 Tax=Rhizobium esperanzae TaxID=1967781 RepID=A0A7W6XW08_9HYPH|nr:transposase [Rhizobium esperanzae]MDH6202491.1 transposase [Rhizobium leguminosarum]